MSESSAIRLRIPRQDLDKPGLFASEQQAVSDWVKQLPMTNVGQTTRQLYQAVAELNRVKMLPELRLTLLEQLRPPIYHVTRALCRHYLNQPLILPPQARKVAELSHRLHQQLATGFTIVAAHTSALGERSGAGLPALLIARAVHRACTDYSLNMLRHFQLYQPVEDGCWHNLHQLYALARNHDAHRQNITDAEFGLCSVENCYKRALLIGASRPSQFRQEDFMGIFKPLTGWAARCELNEKNEGLLAIDTTGDQPPVYGSLLESTATAGYLYLDTADLGKHLLELKATAKTGALKVSEGDYAISVDLICHLAKTWTCIRSRTFMRLESEEQLDLCVGLSSTHHFASGELNFETLVNQAGASTLTMQQKNPFINTGLHEHRNRDVWDSPYEHNFGHADEAMDSIEFDIRKNQTQQQTSSPSKYRYYEVDIVNSSAHGFCISWPCDLRIALKAGEIVGVKEALSHNWNIAIIRWISSRDDEHTQLGLELLSPSASPYGARIVSKAGSQGEYMRVLVLPAIAAIKQPVTLLTPRMPFREGQKIVINQRGKETRVQLDKKLNDTGAYNQFEFRKVASASDNDNDDDFEDLWGKL